MLRDYYAAMKSYAKAYLLYGRMRSPPIAGTPTVRREIREVHGRPLSQPHVITVPLVFQSAWEDARGHVGVFAVNTDRQSTTLTVPAPGSGAWQATIYLGAAQERTQPLASGATLSWHLPPARFGSYCLSKRDKLIVALRLRT